MGTSSSGSGPTGRSSLLPSWADTSDNSGESEDSGASPNDKDADDTNEPTESDSGTSDLDYANSFTGAKGILTSISKGKRGSSFKSFAKSYLRSAGGHKAATKGSSVGIRVGSGYANFFGGVTTRGFENTLKDFGLSDCIGKSAEEVFARIADTIAPIGSTNDEAIARSAVMMALDRLFEKVVEEGKSLDLMDSLNKEDLTDTVVEYVSAYIFKKWVYEAGLALEKNELSETDAIDLENEMRVFIRSEVKSSLKKANIIELDFKSGKGRSIIENIFDLAYSTLEK